MKRLYWTVLACATLAVAGAPASAQPGVACADRDAVAQELRESYGETVRSMGVAENGTLMELFASQDGTWSLVVTTPGGPACLVSSGEHYSPVADKTLVKGRDAF